MTEAVRLSKHLAALLPCSRREAEMDIVGGWVRVDGEGIDNQVPPYIKISWQSEARLRIAAKAILPGQIQQLCTAAGLTVVSIKRVRIGRLPMAKLATGEWRYLGADERI